LYSCIVIFTKLSRKLIYGEHVIFFFLFRSIRQPTAACSKSYIQNLYKVSHICFLEHA
jgi:hypothetical protein